jgi:hypothetical protein
MVMTLMDEIQFPTRFDILLTWRYTFGDKISDSTGDE